MSNEDIKRIVTAFFVAPPVVAIIYFGNSFYFRVLLSIVNLLCILEFLNFSEGKGGPAVKYSALFFGTTIHLSLSHYLPGYTMILIVLFISVLAVLSIIQCSGERRDLILSEMAILFLGTLYISSFLGYYGIVRGFDTGREWIFFAISIIFGSDILAYYTGRLFGRRRFFPQLSPSKTWEGVVAGWVGGISGGLMIKLLFHDFLGWGEVIFLSLIFSILGQIGDLFESMIKRYFGIKDSGRLLPGHGGLWDRIDALMFVAPWVYCYILWVRPFIR